MSGIYQSIPTNLVYSSGDQNIYGIKSFGNTTVSTSTTTGGTTFAGGIGIAGSCYVGNILSTSGNLLVGGAINASGAIYSHTIAGTLNLSNTGVQHTIGGSLYINNTLYSQGRKIAVSNKNISYALSPNDEIILVDASVASRTITLPSASAIGGYSKYSIKKIDSSTNSVILAATSGQTIDGAATVALTTQYASITVFSNGSNWYKY
jgi:hypothetical protein